MATRLELGSQSLHELFRHIYSQSKYISEQSSLRVGERVPSRQRCRDVSLQQTLYTYVQEILFHFITNRFLSIF